MPMASDRTLPPPVVAGRWRGSLGPSGRGVGIAEMLHELSYMGIEEACCLRIHLRLKIG